MAGVDLSQADFSGRTALHIACLHGHKEIVEYLLQNSVDKNTNDLLKLTPIDYAERNNQKEIVNILSDF